MRRYFFLALAVAAACVLAGCGSKSATSSPLSTELSYFPSDSPFVMSVQTDPNAAGVKQAQGLKSAFPLAGVGQAALTLRLSQLGINYDSDIRPLFGNPLMFGLAASGAGTIPRNAFLAVWVTKDASKLDALIGKFSSLLRPAGTHGGATLYQVGHVALATDGATFMVASSQSLLTSAIDRHAGGSGISSSTYERAISGLPQDTLIEAFGSLSGVLSRPSAANAKRVPWIAALRGYAAAITASSSGVTFQYKLDTSGGSLSSEQLPIASGDAAPSLAGDLPIVGALRDPHQAIQFLESGAQATSPASYSMYLARQAALRRKTGVDINTLVGLVEGDLMIESNGHATIGRVGVSDPVAAARTLSKLATQPHGVFAGRTTLNAGTAGFFLIREPGNPPVTVGVVGNQLVAGRKASPAQLHAFATAPAAPASAAHGAVAFRVALPELIRLALRRLPSPVAAQVLNKLGDLTGWTAASTSELTGSATLSLK